MVVGTRIKELLTASETEVDILTKAATEATQRAKAATALKKDVETQHKYIINKAKAYFPGKRGRKPFAPSARDIALAREIANQQRLEMKQQMFAGDDDEEPPSPKKEEEDYSSFGTGPNSGEFSEHATM